MTFDVMQNQITEILSKGNFEEVNKRYIINDMKIPKDWLFVNKALYAQHYGEQETAIYEWL